MRFITQLFPILFNQCKLPVANYSKSTQQHYPGKLLSKKLKNPSATRNSEFIAASLLKQVDLKTPGLKLLEISSGCGQHAGYIAPLCPNITFQPTEFDRHSFDSIHAYAEDCPTKNILAPRYVDVSKEPKLWEEASYAPGSMDYMLNINMMHISPWNCSVGLFRAAGVLLKPNGLLMTYGPYSIDGSLTPESNVQFDLSLKSRNSEWGIRDIRDLKELAAQYGMSLKQMDDMPANNKFLTWIKQG